MELWNSFKKLFLCKKSEQKKWIQLSGHSSSFFTFSGLLCKKCPRNGNEVQVYSLLMQDEKMNDFIPSYHGIFDVNNESFIIIDNLLRHFNDPCILDMKMGIRTFLEEEIANSEPRNDLFEKIIKLDESLLSPEQKATGTITKVDYMQLREQISSSGNLGFRIEGFKVCVILQHSRYFLFSILT